MALHTLTLRSQKIFKDVLNSTFSCYFMCIIYSNLFHSIPVWICFPSRLPSARPPPLRSHLEVNADPRSFAWGGGHRSIRFELKKMQKEVMSLNTLGATPEFGGKFLGELARSRRPPATISTHGQPPATASTGTSSTRLAWKFESSSHFSSSISPLYTSRQTAGRS